MTIFDPSITCQPFRLLQAPVGAKVWRRAKTLSDSETTLLNGLIPGVADRLVNIQRADSKA